MKEILRNWEQEYQADQLGLKLLLEATKKNDYVLSYCGADLFFSLIDVIQRGVSLVKTGADSVPDFETHPPTAQRQEKLRHLLQMYVGADRSVPPTGVAFVLQYIVTRLFNQTMPKLKAFHSTGKRLAPIWYQN